MRRANSQEKTLMLGTIEGRRRRGWQRMRWLDGITDSMDMSEQTPGDIGLQGDPTNQSWIFIGRTDAEGETPVLWPSDAKNWHIWKDPDAVMIEGGRRRGWQRMRWLDATLTQCTWVWVDSSSWWWIGRPGVMQFMGLQRVGHDWMTEMNWTEQKIKCFPPCLTKLILLCKVTVLTSFLFLN